MTLIERLEALTSPVRAVDSEISKAVRGYAFDTELRELYGPHYTASIDAAMTLVPEGLPWSLNYPANDDGSRSCHGIPTKPTADVCGILGHAATPAIALCLAALKARNLP